MKFIKERNSLIPEYHLFSLFIKVYKLFLVNSKKSEIKKKLKNFLPFLLHVHFSKVNILK